MAKDKKDKKKEKKSSTKVDDPATKISKKEGKKEKKSKDKHLHTTDAASALLDALDRKASTATAATEVVVAATKKAVVISPDMLVPFAQPLASDKAAKKVFKCVKKGPAPRSPTHKQQQLTPRTGAKNKSLKRGVKEVVKALRKSPATNAGTTSSANGLVILAADISPMDVISHIPVLCEDHGIPYIFVTSRAELGAAGATKRPTSVVMVLPSAAAAGKKGKKKGEDGATVVAEEDGFKESYDETVKLVEEAQRKVVY
jgi:H/ACA ribonucleoprotein complex subunit 2